MGGLDPCPALGLDRNRSLLDLHGCPGGHLLNLDGYPGDWARDCSSSSGLGGGGGRLLADEVRLRLDQNGSVGGLLVVGLAGS